ncbi:MAG TPA: tRNA uridine-5-carboxymethylaminomethyl(34) synthesis GTPase MnmE [Gammaproteobacteria bacterium]|nr:tRNA uridine-5-carboxymethylaminomethyl(34) synthesis GTPase MnmE [Gammaproteobacteria bacterium]
MDKTSADTIAAIATPPGKGGIGIVRVSGPQVPSLIERYFGRPLPSRQAELRPFRDRGGEILDRGIAIFFEAPHSYTGEHVLELQAHGGPVVLSLLLRYMLELGARPARPGEFTERAFLNDKMDLAQAEAVIDLIDSSSEQAARAAARSLQGAFSHTVLQLKEKLIRLRMHIEAALDFPEEEIDFLADAELAGRMRELQLQLTEVSRSLRVGRLLKEGLSVLILGRPNAGKSSLLNRLAGREAAIVTEIAGTTRDVLREHIHIEGVPLHIIDTAGLRDSADPVEREGVRRAWAEVEQADHVLLIVDDRTGVSPEEEKIIQALPSDKPFDLIRNKIDLSGREPFVETIDVQRKTLGLSAKTGAGIELLLAHLKQHIGAGQTLENIVTARQRHIDAIAEVERHVSLAADQLKARQGELAAEELMLAQQTLGAIIGEFHSDDLLGEIFSSFCIGK